MIAALLRADYGKEVTKGFSCRRDFYKTRIRGKCFMVDWVAFLREVKRKTRAAVAPALFLSLVGYFTWNVIHGDRGLVAYAKRQDLLKLKQAELADANAERDAWERRLASLRGARIDRDMLDERARAQLNLVDPEDIVVPTEDAKRPSR